MRTNNIVIPKYTCRYIRHAERPELPADKSQSVVPLTEHGRKTAREYGISLPTGGKLDIRHTGTERTRETAECIEAGVRSVGGSVSSNNTIRSEYGSYVHSDEIYGLGWQAGFTRKWIRGEIDPAIIDPPEIAGAKLLGGLLDTRRSNCPEPTCNGLYIHVGHDWDIYALQFLLLGLTPNSHPVEWLGEIEISICANRSLIIKRGAVQRETDITSLETSSDTKELLIQTSNALKMNHE